jgi:hypothetical protein
MPKCGHDLRVRQQSLTMSPEVVGAPVFWRAGNMVSVLDLAQSSSVEDGNMLLHAASTTPVEPRVNERPRARLGRQRR